MDGCYAECHYRNFSYEPSFGPEFESEDIRPSLLSKRKEENINGTVESLSSIAAP